MQGLLQYGAPGGFAPGLATPKTASCRVMRTQKTKYALLWHRPIEH